jgi:hypothetical protein
MSTRVLLLISLGLLASLAAHAQPVPAEAASSPSPSASAARQAEPGSTTRVIEDERVRIEETSVRGQLQRITVRSKLTGQEYEIIVTPGGRNPSQGTAKGGDAAGKSGWSVFRF